MDSATTRLLDRPVYTLTTGQAVIIDMRGMAAFTTIAGGGATVTATRVNTQPAKTSGPALSVNVVPAASTSAYTIVDQVATPVDWSFVRFLSTGGACSIAVV